jgi:predicted xylose isomerase-like sugar epimerase
MRIRMIAIAAVATIFLSSSTAFAQQRHVVDASSLRQAVAGKVHTDAQNRAAVRSVLQQTEVRQMAERLGLNLVTADAAVGTMNSADLARVATSAREADKALAGGANTLVISTTTLLLILIIVLLVAD